MKKIFIVLVVFCTFSTAFGQYNIDRKAVGNGAVNSSNGGYRVTGTIKVGDLPTAPEEIQQGFTTKSFRRLE